MAQILAVALVLVGMGLFAQAPAPLDAPPAAPVRLPDPASSRTTENWTGVASALILAISAIGSAWVGNAQGSLRRERDEAKKRADDVEADAKTKISEIVDRLESCTREKRDIEAELKAAQKERDAWVRRAYASGYRSPDDSSVTETNS